MNGRRRWPVEGLLAELPCREHRDVAGPSSTVYLAPTGARLPAPPNPRAITDLGSVPAEVRARGDRGSGHGLRRPPVRLVPQGSGQARAPVVASDLGRRAVSGQLHDRAGLSDSDYPKWHRAYRPFWIGTLPGVGGDPPRSWSRDNICTSLGRGSSDGSESAVTTRRR